AAERPQREGDAALERDRRVTAGEDEPEPVVLERLGVAVAGHGHLARRARLELALERAGSARAVDRAVARDGREPGGGPRRDPLAGPALERERERVLESVLGGVEVAARVAHERRHYEAVLAAEDGLDLVLRGSHALLELEAHERPHLDVTAR